MGNDGPIGRRAWIFYAILTGFAQNFLAMRMTIKRQRTTHEAG